MARPAHQISLTGEPATLDLGNVIAGHLLPGHIVLLEGDLGAGKTTLARAIIRNLMQDANLEVPSPSFALVQPYEGAGHHIIHADLYRLADESELDELGILEDPDAIVLVEWPERAPDLSARADLRVQLSLEDGGRKRVATLSSPSGRFDLSALS